MIPSYNYVYNVTSVFNFFIEPFVIYIHNLYIYIYTYTLYIYTHIYIYIFVLYISIYYIYIYIHRKKVFVKDSMSKRKKCRFSLFRFLDYQMNYYEI